jgi:hypothetical protein
VGATAGITSLTKSLQQTHVAAGEVKQT